MTPPLAPDEATRRFEELLDDAGIPRFEESDYNEDDGHLYLQWPNGVVLCVDLAAWEPEPLDEFDRAMILGLPCPECGPIDIYVPGSPTDPRDDPGVVGGVRVRRGPPLHPDDRAVVHGIPCTSLARTLIDCAEILSRDELRDAFSRALEQGLEREALEASRGRVEWRPSLAMFDEVMGEFFG